MDCISGFNRTALMLGGSKGHLEMMTLLVERRDVRADCRAKHNQTALMLTYEYEHEKVAELLGQAAVLGEPPEAGEQRDDREYKNLIATKSKHEPRSKLVHYGIL